MWLSLAFVLLTVCHVITLVICFSNLFGYHNILVASHVCWHAVWSRHFERAKTFEFSQVYDPHIPISFLPKFHWFSWLGELLLCEPLWRGCADEAWVDEALVCWSPCAAWISWRWHCTRIVVCCVYCKMLTRVIGTCYKYKMIFT